MTLSSNMALVPAQPCLSSQPELLVASVRIDTITCSHTLAALDPQPPMHIIVKVLRHRLGCTERSSKAAQVCTGSDAPAHAVHPRRLSPFSKEGRACADAENPTSHPQHRRSGAPSRRRCPHSPVQTLSLRIHLAARNVAGAAQRQAAERVHDARQQLRALRLSKDDLRAQVSRQRLHVACAVSKP